MASLTWWTWVWTSSRRWQWAGKPGVLQSMGSQSWTRLSNWTKTSVQSRANFYLQLKQDFLEYFPCHAVNPVLLVWVVVVVVQSLSCVQLCESMDGKMSGSSVLQFSSVQSLSRVWLFATPWIVVLLASLSITISWGSLKLTSIESVMPSSHLILCHPLFLLPPIPPSIRVFFNESTFCMRWPKSWSFSFSIIPSKEHPGLISFRMDWLDLLAVQETLKNLHYLPNLLRFISTKLVMLVGSGYRYCSWLSS